MTKQYLLSILLLSASLAGVKQSTAQSVIGSWLKTSENLTKADGTTVNSLEKINKAMHCSTPIVYIFSTGGKIKEDASGCSAMIQKTTTSMDQQTSWKQTGDKLTMDYGTPSDPSMHRLFHIRFAGNNEMSWTFIYAENPATPNPTKAKEMTTIYRRK